MVFTSWAFVIFFAIFLLGFSLMPGRRSRQLWILLASAVFYSYWDYRFLLLLAAPSVIDYICAIRIADTSSTGARKVWLAASVITNLGLLGYFKYTNFFLAAFAGLAHVHATRLDIILPVGISFFTFKTLSYTIDVYRRDMEPCRSAWRYAMFISYFPELIAGPIVRASVFLPQMTRSLRPSWARIAIGSQIVLLGVTKKLLIADRLSIFVDPVFQRPTLYSQGTIIEAVVAYSVQIYCDFSGYSDIAIGISRMIGFDLPENFNMPYLATSVTEFWRRWHMTLSGWLRDYLYIPLGGNRRGALRTYVNLMATMLLGGLWHGASWNFVIWGGLHGLGLGVHKIWTARGRRLHPVAGWLLTYGFLCITWVLFRADNLPTAVAILSKIFGLAPGGAEWFYSPLAIVLLAVVLAHLVGTFAQDRLRQAGTIRKISPPKWLALVYQANGNRLAVRPHKAAGVYVLAPVPGMAGSFVITVWLLALYLFSPLSTSPFIYFQF